MGDLVPLGNYKDPYEILELYEDAVMRYGADFQRMREISLLMNNKMPIPLPELSEDERNTVANLALSGMDQLARRMASVEPLHYWPNLDPGHKHADWRAANKPRVMSGWHAENHIKLLASQRARYFLAYATTPVQIRPDKRLGIPRWHENTPLNTYLPKGSFMDLRPPWSITVSTYAYSTLMTMFGREVVQRVSKPDSWNHGNEYSAENMAHEFEVLTYNDDYETSMILLGEYPYGAPSPSNNYAPNERSADRIAYSRNLVDEPLTVSVGRITLDEQLGHFDGIVGMYQTQAALMALTVIAQRKATWPTDWVVPHPNSPADPEIVNFPNPYAGTPGEIHGGTIERVNMDPAFRALEMMDRQAEEIRTEAGIPAEFGAQSATNIRTGKRGGQIMGAAIDFTIKEAQDLFAASLKEENKLAIKIDKKYFNTKKTYFIETRGYVGKVEYKPSDLWDHDNHVVDYPFGGVDLQNLVIEGGQRVASGTMSRHTFMEIDPAVPDVPAEIQRLHRQGLQDAILSAIQMQAAVPEGGLAIDHVARLDKKLAEGVPLYQAWGELQKEVQEEQATPAGPGAPETQPGMSPNQGVEQPEAIPEMDQSMNRMTQLLGSLGTVQTAQKYR